MGMGIIKYLCDGIEKDSTCLLELSWFVKTISSLSVESSNSDLVSSCFVKIACWEQYLMVQRHIFCFFSK